MLREGPHQPGRACSPCALVWTCFPHPPSPGRGQLFPSPFSHCQRESPRLPQAAHALCHVWAKTAAGQELPAGVGWGLQSRLPGLCQGSMGGGCWNCGRRAGQSRGGQIGLPCHGVGQVPSSDSQLRNPALRGKGRGQGLCGSQAQVHSPGKGRECPVGTCALCWYAQQPTLQGTGRTRTP